MPVFRHHQHQVHTLHGNHVTGIATPASGAREVEMWFGRMDANASTPPHSHDTEEVVHILTGSGRAIVSERLLHFQAGDTLVLPRGERHQIFAETDSTFVAAMPIGGTVKLPDGDVMELPWRR